MYEFCNNSATCNSCRGRDLFHSLNKILPFIKISTLVSCLPLLLLGGHLVSFSFFLLIFPRKRPIIFIASLYLAVSIGHPKSELLLLIINVEDMVVTQLTMDVDDHNGYDNNHLVNSIKLSYQHDNIYKS
jgi:hypothetical protein